MVRVCHWLRKWVPSAKTRRPDVGYDSAIPAALGPHYTTTSTSRTHRMADSRMPMMSRAVLIFLSTSRMRQFSYSHSCGSAGTVNRGRKVNAVLSRYTSC